MKKITTLVFLILTPVLAYLGLHCMKEMLNVMQNNALQQTGSFPIAVNDMSGDSGILKWSRTASTQNEPEDTNPNEKSFEPTATEGALSLYMVIPTESLKDIVESMESTSYLSLHEPYDSQLTMDQAVSAGNEWIEKMYSLCNEYFGVVEPVKYEMVSAKLYGHNIAEYSGLPTEFFSYWNIHYKIKDTMGEELFLCINAVTGRVLHASIYSYIMDFTEYNESSIHLYLNAFAENAGLAKEDFSAVSFGSSSDDAPYEIMSVSNGDLLLILDTFKVPSIGLSVMNIHFSTKFVQDSDQSLE